MTDHVHARPDGEGKDDPLFWELNERFSHPLHETADGDPADYRVRTTVRAAGTVATGIDGVVLARTTTPGSGGACVAYFSRTD